MPDGQQKGFEEKEIRQMWATGQLRRDALYWKEGLTEWRPLAEMFAAPKPKIVVPKVRNASDENHKQQELDSIWKEAAKRDGQHAMPWMKDLEPDATKHGSPGPNKNMVVGAVCCIIGIVVTVGTYLNAASSPTGGRYIIAWGAMLFGGIMFLRGVFQVLKKADASHDKNRSAP
jgi:hypothetical protein